MIFNIPKWPNDNELTHYATTWKLTRDVNGDTVEDEVSDSTDFLDYWEVDKIIPTGEIWYVSALRKLKDSDGNDINNETWIGPKPVFNEESNKKEYLTPELYITDPFIKDIAYQPGNHLAIELTMPKTNVDYTGTLVSLYNDANELIYEKNIVIDENNNVIVINNTEVDFSLIYKLGISLVNIASHSTISKVIRDAFFIKKVYYNIEGNRNDLDPLNNNIFKIVSTSEIGIKATKAEILNMNNEVLLDAYVFNNEVTLPNSLSLDSTYKVKFYLSYIDSDGSAKKLTDIINITTYDKGEAFTYDRNHIYKYELSKLTDFINANLDVTTNAFNTEEFYTYLVPIVNKNNTIDLTILDKVEYKFVNHKSTNLSMSEDFTIRLVNKTSGYIQTRSTDGLLILTNFRYDPFKDTVTLGASITTDIKIDTAVSRKVMELSGKLYVAGVNKDNAKQIVFYELDLEAMTLTFITNYSVVTDLTDISLSELNDVEILILPKGPSAFQSIMFSILDNYVTKALSIHTDFKNKDLISFRLKNNTIAVFKLRDTDKKLNFFLYDKEKYMITNKNANYTRDGILDSFITTKNGEIYLLVNNPTTDKREFFKFH